MTNNQTEDKIGNIFNLIYIKINKEKILERGRIKMKREVVKKIVKASGIQPGELVLLHFWGESDTEEILEVFAEAVLEAGASPLELRESRIRNQKKFAIATKDSFNAKYFSVFSQVDTVLDIFTYQPVVLGGVLEEHQMNHYRNYMGQLIRTLGTAPRFLQIRIPTVDHAMESGLNLEEYVKRMEEAYDIDYDQLKKKCEMVKKKMEAVGGVSLMTGEGHSLQIFYEGREWYVDAGDGDLPCGEIYIAPQEDRTEGEVFFEKFYIENAGVYTNVLLSIKKGVIDHSDNVEVNAFLQGLKDCDKTVCELGFGMNENVHNLCGYTVLDEKMNGTFHIAIGDNTMFGGKNHSNLHMDFVGKATIGML